LGGGYPGSACQDRGADTQCGGQRPQSPHQHRSSHDPSAPEKFSASIAPQECAAVQLCWRTDITGGNEIHPSPRHVSRMRGETPRRQRLASILSKI
jgi:hypothetical protein